MIAPMKPTRFAIAGEGEIIAPTAVINGISVNIVSKGNPITSDPRVTLAVLIKISPCSCNQQYYEDKQNQVARFQ